MIIPKAVRQDFPQESDKCISEMEIPNCRQRFQPPEFKKGFIDSIKTEGCRTAPVIVYLKMFYDRFRARLCCT